MDEKIMINCKKELQDALPKKLHLTDTSLQLIENYYRLLLNDSDEVQKTVFPSHLWINTSNEETNRSIASSIFFPLSKRIENFSAISITEEALLERPEVLLDNKSTTIFLIHKCGILPLSEDTLPKWIHLSEVLSDKKCSSCFLLTSKDTFNLRFQNHTNLKETLELKIFKSHIEEQPVEGAFPAVDKGTFFEFDHNSPAVHGPKNLLLLSLSTIGAPKESTITIPTVRGDEPVSYYYQLEPVPYLLMNQFMINNIGKNENEKEQLDGILMICSPKTLDLEVDINDPRYNGWHKDTARNYFVYTTSDFAKKCQSPISYKKIRTKSGSDELDAKIRAVKRSKNNLQFIKDVIMEIRRLKEHYPDLNIHVDTHGGFRTEQEALNNILSLLQMENIELKPENIHSIEFEPSSNGPSHAYFTSYSEIFDIINFVSGIHESINYGQIKSLDQSMKNFKGEIEQKVLDSMRTTAEGIQLCDVNKFESGLSNLSDSLKKLGGTPASLDNSSYLRLFQDLIRDSYGDELLDNSKRKTINEIKWCIEKDFIQQALTLVESKMPKEIIEHNFLYCKELFDVTPSGTIIKKSEKEHLNDDNSPKQR